MNNDLSERWFSLAQNYCRDEALIQKFWEEISEHYNHPDRYYHNFSHLSAMMERFDRCQAEIKEPDCLQFAIFYHDIILSF